MSGLEFLLRDAVKHGMQQRNEKPSILPEAAIARLQELLPAYRQGKPPFAVGDIVIPRKDASIRGHGSPHLVVDILEDAHAIYRFDESHFGSNTFGACVNMRVIHVDDEKVVAHWVESADFELFKE